MGIFEKKSLKAQNTFQTIFGQKPKTNFLIEVENLLATYETSLDSITESKIEELVLQYKINLKSDFLAERTNLFRKLLSAQLENSNFANADFYLLKHISDVLRLPEEVFNAEYAQFASEYYARKINTYLSDEVIDTFEKQALDTLKDNLHLSSDTANEVYRKCVKSIMDSYTAPIFASEVFSPQDEEKMYDAAKRLGLNLTFPESVKEKLARYRENWELHNGRLPILQSDIRLQNNEQLHFKIFVKWLEERAVTKRVNYSGFTYSTQVIGKIRWKAGTVIPNRIQSSELKEIDTGIVYITSKRILFNGRRENKNIPYNKILNFQPYTDGILIERESGKSPFLAFNCDIEKAAMILAHLLS